MSHKPANEGLVKDIDPKAISFMKSQVVVVASYSVLKIVDFNY